MVNPSSVMRAMSIAISYLVYNVEGFVGLDQIHRILELSLIDFRHGDILSSFFVDNYTDYKENNILVNEKILESLKFEASPTSQLHGYRNDIGFIFYVIAAFKICSLLLFLFIQTDRSV